MPCCEFTSAESEVKLLGFGEKGEAVEGGSRVHHRCRCKGNHFFEEMNPCRHFREVCGAAVLPELDRGVPCVSFDVHFVVAVASECPAEVGDGLCSSDALLADALKGEAVGLCGVNVA